MRAIFILYVTTVCTPCSHTAQVHNDISPVRILIMHHHGVPALPTTTHARRTVKLSSFIGSSTITKYILARGYLRAERCCLSVRQLQSPIQPTRG